MNKNSIWINKKNNKEYCVIDQAIDCTNDRDGLEVVIYTTKTAPGKFFVREKKEFLEKFYQKREKWEQ
jgi:hypothetical protein